MAGMLPRSFALVFLCSACLIVAASPEHAFDWGFPGTTSTELTECASVTISTTVINTSSTYTGTPPFYFTAYELGGIPTIQVLNPDKQGNVNWTVDHQVGSLLALSILDSEGRSGAMADTFYRVTSSSGDDCLPTLPNNPPRITANVTSPDLISTCDPWGLNITGGLSPYTVTLLALHQSTQINITLGQQDDGSTFINRFAPSSTIIAAVLDANGDFGAGTVHVKTDGSNDTSCTSALSHTSAPVPQTSPPLPHSSAPLRHPSAWSKHARTLAIALSIAVIVLFAIAIVVYIHVRRRRRQHLGLSHPPDSDKLTDNDRWFRSTVTPAILRRPASVETRPCSTLRKALRPQPSLPQARAGNPGGMSEIKDLQGPTTPLPARRPSPPAVKQPGSQDSSAPLVSRSLSAIDAVFQHEDAEDAVARNELPPPYRTR